jgi:mono/diheme cytochrome c family protein
LTENTLQPRLVDLSDLTGALRYALGPASTLTDISYSDVNPSKGCVMLPLRMILLATAIVTTLGISHAFGKNGQKAVPKQPSVSSGMELFLKYCASCHGENGKGKTSAASALNTPPTDLTTLSKRHNDKYPSGYVTVLLKFGRSSTAHGSTDMPVWGTKFGQLDPVNDPTGQQHIDDVVAYIKTLQVN